MIEIKDVKPGLTVYYGDYSDPEYGTITSWNKLYVFVRFSGETTSKACRPEDLSWPPDYMMQDIHIIDQLFSDHY